MVQDNICSACGTAFDIESKIPPVCPVCEDDRQFVPEGIQVWTNIGALSNDHTIRIKQKSEALYELKMIPEFAIGQRAFLILSPNGNILWDCIPLLDKSTIAFIKSKGGLKAIAFSHPHFYSSMNVWADVFNCPIYIHMKDRNWIFNKGNRLNLWEDIEKELWDGIRIINIGGHFPGSSILYIPFFSTKGLILCSDTLFIARNHRNVAVMHSYPNIIPLPKLEIQRIKKQFSLLQFDSLYGAFDFQNVSSDPKSLVQRSLERFLT